MSSRLIHVVTFPSIFKVEWYSMCVHFKNSSSVDIWVISTSWLWTQECKYTFKIIKKTFLRVNTDWWDCWIRVGSFFNPLRELRTVFHSSCAPSQSQQQSTRFPLLHFLSNIYRLLNGSPLMDARSCVTVLIWIPLMTDDVEHCFHVLVG